MTKKHEDEKNAASAASHKKPNVQAPESRTNEKNTQLENDRKPGFLPNDGQYG